MTDKSDLEEAFLFYVNALRLPPPAREWRFHPKRRWRFDFAWPEHNKVAVECEGGVWMQTSSGRSKGHAHPVRFEDDCWKYNAAAVMGWKVLRVTGGMLDRAPLDFLELLIEALGGRMMKTKEEQEEEDDGVHYYVGGFESDEDDDSEDDQ